MNRLAKTQLLLGILWLVIMPWLTGGQEPVAVLISLFAQVAAVFLVWRMPVPAVLRRGLFISASTAFILWSAVSLAWSVNSYQTVHAVILLVLAAATFILAYQFHDRWPQIKRWWQGYAVIAAVFSVIGFWFYVTGGYPRLTSTFYWANPFAAFLIPVVLIAGWYYITSGRRVYLAALLPSAVAFVLTDSRGAMIIVALVILGVLYKAKLPPQAWTRLLASVAIIFALAAGLNMIRQHRHLATLAPGSRFAPAAEGENLTSQQDRLYYLRSALLIWKDHPLIGTGAGTYGSVHPHYQLRVISAASNAHNYLGQTLAELGLVGGLLLALMAVGLAQSLMRAVKGDPRLVPFAIVLAALLVHFALDIDSSYPAVVLLMATIAGFMYRPPVKTKTAPNYVPIVLAGLLAVGLPVVSLYRSQLSATAGEQAQADGDYQLAASQFNLAHAGTAYNPDTLTAEGINELTLARQGQSPNINLALAKDRATTAIKLDRYDAQHHFLLARVLNLSGQPEAAEKEYLKAIEIDPYNNPDYYTDLAQLYELTLHNPQAALDYANRGVSLYNDQVVSNRSADTNIPRQVSNLLTIRSLILLNQQQLTSARADAIRAIKYNPKNRLAAQILEKTLGDQ